MEVNNDRIQQLKDYLGDNYDDSILEKLKNVKDEEELQKMLEEYGGEFSEDQLDATSGGSLSVRCGRQRNGSWCMSYNSGSVCPSHSKRNGQS